MKKTIILLLVIGFIFVVKFCSHQEDVREYQDLPTTKFQTAKINLGDETYYALSENKKLIASAQYFDIRVEDCVIVAENSKGLHVFNLEGYKINNLYFTSCQTTKDYALLESTRGTYIYDARTDMLSSSYQQVIPQPESYIVKGVNGWGVLNQEMLAIIPTCYQDIRRLTNHQAKIGYAVQEQDGKWKYFSLKGQELGDLPPSLFSEK